MIFQIIHAGGCVVVMQYGDFGTVQCKTTVHNVLHSDLEWVSQFIYPKPGACFNGVYTDKTAPFNIWRIGRQTLGLWVLV
jgi:hypothetical protein